MFRVEFRFLVQLESLQVLARGAVNRVALMKPVFRVGRRGRTPKRMLRLLRPRTRTIKFYKKPELRTPIPRAVFSPK